MLKCEVPLLSLAIVVACLPGLAAAQTPGQQPDGPAPEQAVPAATPASVNSIRPPHQIKIWTNEDLLETRTPADRYIFAKEEKAASDRDAEIRSITSCFAPGNNEPTLEETQKDISDTTGAIAEAEEGVAQARRQVAEDPENLRTRDQSELNRRTAELNRLLDHLHTLQARLQESSPQTGAPATSPPTPAPAPESLPMPEPQH